MARLRASWKTSTGRWQSTLFWSDRAGINFAVVFETGGDHDVVDGLFERREDAEGFAKSHPQRRFAEICDARREPRDNEINRP